MSKVPEDDKLIGTPSSGNIFTGLGFNVAWAIDLNMRVHLLLAVKKWFKASGLTRTAAATKLDIREPDFKLFLESKVSEFSLDALVNIASAAGLKVKLNLGQPTMKALRAVKAA
jgi:predicted XRE-type DNA-binding protein